MIQQLLSIVASYASDEKTALKYAEHIEELFDVISPERIGEKFCAAMKENNARAAISACADYYRQREPFAIPELSAKGDYSIEEAEKCVKGIARVVNIDWTFPNGEIDFLFDPTEKNGSRNHEWLWQFNRHASWVHLARTYEATKDTRYLIAFEKQLLKWIAQTDIPEEWNAHGSAWRTIECGLRLLRSWPIAYDGFYRSLSDVALLLMIASMHRQTVHLTAHPTGRNWLMMETNGAYAFSALFPELSDSFANRKLASERLLSELEKQILPDGMHDELSPDYQSVVQSCSFNFYRISEYLGVTHELPANFLPLIKKTTDAAVALSTPAFTQPRTNDTFTIKTRSYTERAAKLFPDDEVYRFVNSARAQGKPPKGETASVFLPYAGFAVMRSDWGADASYLCFDVGPLGMAHIHQDMLNINFFKGSQELLYDDGGGQYESSPARTYACSAYAHNTVLVDGLAQSRKGPKRYHEAFDANWQSNEVFDYAAAVYDGTFGEEYLTPATHKREVRFTKTDIFCVSDTLTSVDSRTHDYELLFHLDTTSVSTLDRYQNGVITHFGKEYELAIIPLDDGAETVRTEIFSAVKEPRMCGWYNGRNDQNLHPATTLVRKVTGVRNFRFHTLLIPVKKGETLPTVEKSKDGEVRVCLNGKDYRFNLNALNR